MDDQQMMEPVTPAHYRNASYWRTDDSGYHTSFTPGSLECSEISNENLDPTLGKCYRNEDLEGSSSTGGGSGARASRRGRRYRRPAHHYDTVLESPRRRGIKRTYQEDADATDTSLCSAPTPTRLIAGGIQRLKVNDSGLSPITSEYDNDYRSTHLYTLEATSYPLSYPTTPVKKICRAGVKTSPMSYADSLQSSPLRTINNLSCPPRRSAKKLHFANPVSCEAHIAHKPKPLSKVVRTIFRPEQKIDIVKMLYHKVCTMPAINMILSYLSNEDIYNFSLVSPTWHQVCEENAKSKKREYVEFITNTKENHENRNKNRGNEVCKNVDSKGGSLKDIYNIVNSRIAKNSPTRSPPTTPKTRRFKTFTKSASLDSRIQLSCVRCRQPSKVTEEPSGEEWAQCSSLSCAYQFCRFCKCDRHPNKVCFRYDLDGPSPSKRKKKMSAVGTKKSKKNLRRLLD